MIAAIFILLACQLAGEAIHRLAGVPLPGSVIGMVLLLAWLAVRPRERPMLDKVTGWLIGHMTIMFVPAAVGIVDETGPLARYGLGIAVAVTVSTLLTMVVTVLVFRWAAARGDGEEQAS